MQCNLPKSCMATDEEGGRLKKVGKEESTIEEKKGERKERKGKRRGKKRKVGSNFSWDMKEMMRGEEEGKGGEGELGLLFVDLY